MCIHIYIYKCIWCNIVSICDIPINPTCCFFVPSNFAWLLPSSLAIKDAKTWLNGPFGCGGLCRGAMSQVVADAFEPTASPKSNGWLHLQAVWSALVARGIAYLWLFESHRVLQHSLFGVLLKNIGSTLTANDVILLHICQQKNKSILQHACIMFLGQIFETKKWNNSMNLLIPNNNQSKINKQNNQNMASCLPKSTSCWPKIHGGLIRLQAQRIGAAAAAVAQQLLVGAAADVGRDGRTARGAADDLRQ